MAVLLPVLRLWGVRWYGCGTDVRLGGRGPIHEILIGLIPPPRPVRRRLELPPYLPVAFHAYSPLDVLHQERRQMDGDGNGRGGGTSGVAPDLDGSGKMGHL